MSTEEKIQQAGESPISHAASELRRAAAEKEQRLAAPRGRYFEAASAARKPSAGEKMGFDPYNTAGAFDPKKIWARVDKR